MPKSSSFFDEEIANLIVEYVPGWLKTIGDIGAPPDGDQADRKGQAKYAAPNVRAQAAKIGLDLFSKMVGDGEAPKGKELLAKLKQAREMKEGDLGQLDDPAGPAPLGESPADVDATEGSGP